MSALKGTAQPCRRRERLVPPIDGELVKPTWLKGRAAKLWHEKLEVYRRRGQGVAGCEAALAQFCALEAALIDQWRRGNTPSMAAVNAWRGLAASFYDTPSSQVGSPAAAGQGDLFAANMPKSPIAEAGHA